jgi:hypothetical protein
MKKKTLPFAILAIIHILLIVYTFTQKKHKTLIVLFSSIGIAYVFEYFVLNVFKMYRYYPKVFRNGWVDSVFGALLSQSLFVPITATLMVLFHLGWKWRIGAGLAYGLIETVFIKWNIYKNYQWRTVFTITTMPIYFYVVKKWWEALQKKNAKIIPALSVFFYFWVNYTNIYYFLLAFFKKFVFHLGIVKDKYWEHFMLVPLYTFYQSVIGTISTMYSCKKTKIGCLILLHISDQLIFKYKIIQSTKRDLYSFIPVHLLIFTFGEYYYKWMKEYR